MPYYLSDSQQQSQEKQGISFNSTNKRWTKIKSDRQWPKKRQIQEIKKQTTMSIKKKQTVISYNDRKNDIQNFNQSSTTSCDRQRKRRKNLQKQEVMKMRDIFQQWQDCTDANQFTCGKLAKKFNVSLSTIIRIRSQYHKDPTLASVIQKIERTSATGRKRGSMNDSTKVVRCLVYNQLMKNRFLTRKQLQMIIQNNKDVRQLQIKIPSLKTISKIIQSLNIYRKRIRLVPKMTKAQDYLQKRLQFCQKYKAAKRAHASIVFIDLREIYLFTRPTYAWVQKGSNVQLQIPTSREQKVMILVGINQNKTIIFQTKIGSFSDQEYSESLQRVLVGLYSGSCSSKNNQVLLVVNNKQSQCQYQKILSKFNNQQTVQVIELPPCSPLLNPIETWFQQLRASVKQTQYDTVYQLLNAIKRQSRILEVQSTKNYMYQIDKYVQKGLKKQAF